MTTILQMRADIVSTIKTAIPAFKEVGPHHGVFDVAELARYATATPSCWVVCLGWDGTEVLRGGAILKPNVIWGVYVLTKDQSNIPRGDQALILCTALEQRGSAAPEH